MPLLWDWYFIKIYTTVISFLVCFFFQLRLTMEIYDCNCMQCALLSEYYLPTRSQTWSCFASGEWCEFLQILFFYLHVIVCTEAVLFSLLAFRPIKYCHGLVVLVAVVVSVGVGCRLQLFQLDLLRNYFAYLLQTWYAASLYSGL